MDRFALILIVSFVLYQSLQIASVEKNSLQDFDEQEMYSVKVLNESRIKKGLKPLIWNLKFMDIAQAESERLARLGTIDVLEIDTSLKYHAYMFKYEKIIKGSWVGVKAFYTNLIPMTQVKSVDLSEPYVGNEQIDSEKNYAVAFGRTLDEYGHIYCIRIFLTSQNDLLQDETTQMNDDDYLPTDEFQHLNKTQENKVYLNGTTKKSHGEVIIIYQPNNQDYDDRDYENTIKQINKMQINNENIDDDNIIDN